MSLNIGLVIILAAAVLAAVVVVVVLLRRIEKLKIEDRTEDREFMELVKEAEEALKDEEAKVENLKDLIRRQQQSALAMIQENNRLEKWIMDVINLSGHQYGDCPDERESDKECILCELYRAFVLDKVEEIKEARDG